MPDIPIFIIGAARSGTKFLRNCLSGDRRVAAVPYDVNYIWRYGQSHGSDDVLLPSSLKQQHVRFIRRAIQKQAGLKDGYILLEKTVSNSLRVPFVEAVYPGARYVHLVRDGRDVVTSAMKEWSAPTDYHRLLEKLRRIPLASLPYLLWYMRNSVLNNSKRSATRSTIWGPRYPGIDIDIKTRPLTEVCALQWKYSLDFACNDLANIESERVFTIRYEDMITDGAAIAQLAEALALDSQAITRNWEATVNRGRRRELTPEEQHTRDEIETFLADTLKALKY